MVGFFAVSVVFVKACEIIVGPDAESQRVEETEADSAEQAAA